MERSNAQVGWLGSNRKSLELSDIAPTWVHHDVHSCEPQYLKDSLFCTDDTGRDRPLPIMV